MEKALSNIQNHIINMKSLHELILKYIDAEEDDLTNFNQIVNFIGTLKIRSNKIVFYEFLNLISNISYQHHHTNNFYAKLENLIKYYQEDIKKYFQNYIIFNIFSKNKRILLFLLENKIIFPDQDIFNTLLTKKFIDQQYLHYLYPEFEDFINKYNDVNDILPRKIKIDDRKLYDEFRKSGQNETLICQMIRNDSIVEFISYVNKENISLYSTIKKSIYETNPLLITESRTTLIEYTAFYGSIQIFQYLQNNNVKLTSSLWTYAIHSNNPELINILENENVSFPQNDFYDEDESNSNLELYNELYQCHHIEFLNYFRENLIKNEEAIDKHFELCASYSNYIEMNSDYINESSLTNVFSISCKYGLLCIIDSILKNKCIDINSYFTCTKEKKGFKYEYSITPLIQAIKYENIAVVEFFLTNPEIMVNLISIKKIVDDDEIYYSEKNIKYSPLYYSVKKNNNYICKLLLSHANIDINSNYVYNSKSTFSETETIKEIKFIFKFYTIVCCY